MRKPHHGVAPQRDLCGFQSGKWRLVGGDRLHGYDIGGGKLGVVIQLLVKVQSPVTRTIAIA
jgi:hypothetical protein